jgi:hypothetical protein
MSALIEVKHGLLALVFRAVFRVPPQGLPIRTTMSVRGTRPNQESPCHSVLGTLSKIVMPNYFNVVLMLEAGIELKA